MPDEVRRLGALLRVFAWSVLVVFAALATALSVVNAHDTFQMLGFFVGIAGSVFLTLWFERRGSARRAATILVTCLWLVAAVRLVEIASVGRAAWFMMALIVGIAGLFIGLRGALVVAAASAVLGLAIVILGQRGVVIPEPRHSPYFDWFAGLFMFILIAALQFAAVTLYQGGLETARIASRRHRALFDNAPVALIEVDLRGISGSTPEPASITVTDLNETAVRLLGGSREDLATGPALDAVWRAVVRAHLDGQRLVEQEIELEIQNAPRHIVVRAELTPDDLGRTIVSLADVTDQRRAIEQLHDAKRLETVTLLAGSVAHDFNNLLTVIRMNADRIGRRAPDIASSRELERMGDAITRAAGLTRQLLLFSRRDITQRRVFDPDRVLEVIEPALRRMLDPEISLVLEHAPEPTSLDMDDAQLRLIIENLVHNAADAMPAGGSIHIVRGVRTITGSEPERELRELAPGTYVSIVVRDTGRGMDPAILARAFEPFVTSRPGKRPGLGLSVIHGIVAQAAGAVVITSEPERGTSVEVVLPRGTAAAPAPEVAAKPGGAERILLVEDEDGVREIARATLEDAGYRVTAVANSDEAIAAFHAGNTHDLVVSDLVMPGLGGRVLVSRLRAIRPSVSVLFVSGHAADGQPDVDGDPRSGFLAKPFTAAQLLASVRSVLRQTSAA